MCSSATTVTLSTASNDGVRTLRWAGATAVASAVLSVSSCSSPSAPAARNPSPTLSARPASCTGDIALVTSSGARTQFRLGETVPVTMRVGEQLSIDAPGPCGSDVGATPQRAGVLVVTGTGIATRFRAMTAGMVKLLIAYPACDDAGEFSKGTQCRGGITGGYAIVTVHP